MREAKTSKGNKVEIPEVVTTGIPKIPDADVPKTPGGPQIPLTDQIIAEALSQTAQKRPIPKWKTMGLTRIERCKRELEMSLRGMTRHEIAEFFGITHYGVNSDLRYIRDLIIQSKEDPNFKDNVAAECYEVAMFLRGKALSYVDKTKEESSMRKGAIEVALTANKSVIDLVIRPKIEIDANVGGGVVYMPLSLTDEEWAKQYSPKDGEGRPIVKEHDDIG